MARPVSAASSDSAAACRAAFLLLPYPASPSTRTPSRSTEALAENPSRAADSVTCMAATPSRWVSRARTATAIAGPRTTASIAAARAPAHAC